MWFLLFRFLWRGDGVRALRVHLCTSAFALPTPRSGIRSGYPRVCGIGDLSTPKLLRWTATCILTLVAGVGLRGRGRAVGASWRGRPLVRLRAVASRRRCIPGAKRVLGEARCIVVPQRYVEIQSLPDIRLGELQNQFKQIQPPPRQRGLALRRVCHRFAVAA